MLPLVIGTIVLVIFTIVTLISTLDLPHIKKHIEAKPLKKNKVDIKKAPTVNSNVNSFVVSEINKIQKFIECLNEQIEKIADAGYRAIAEYRLKNLDHIKGNFNALVTDINCKIKTESAGISALEDIYDRCISFAHQIERYGFRDDYITALIDEERLNRELKHVYDEILQKVELIIPYNHKGRGLKNSANAIIDMYVKISTEDRLGEERKKLKYLLDNILAAADAQIEALDIPQSKRYINNWIDIQDRFIDKLANTTYEDNLNLKL